MRVRVGTIVWGAILLAFAAIAFGVAVFDLREFQAAAVAWIATGLGGVFVLAAIIALIARAVSGADPELPASAATEPDAPTKVGNSKVSAGSAVSTGSTTGKGQPVD
jgi:uncharacterized membrane protein YeiB